MNEKELKIIMDVYRDCKKLEKTNDLTEFGRGQLSLCKTILKMK